MTDAIREVFRAAEALLEALESSRTHLEERTRLARAVVSAEILCRLPPGGGSAGAVEAGGDEAAEEKERRGDDNG